VNGTLILVAALSVVILQDLMDAEAQLTHQDNMDHSLNTPKFNTNKVFLDKILVYHLGLAILFSIIYFIVIDL